jgi:hypothetical protein
MILSPVQIKTDDGNVVEGVLLEKVDLEHVITVIDNQNSDGLLGEDVMLLMKLKEAAADLLKAEGK